MRHIGIRDGKIAVVSEQPLSGKTVLPAAGRIVAPGFIDLHSHGQTNQANEYQAHDGVTTALELEIGVPAVGIFLKARENKSILNFGATASHSTMRTMAMREFASEAEAWRNTQDQGFEINLKGRYRQLTDAEEYTLLAAMMERGLREGGLGLGVAPQYYPGATREEIFRVFQMAQRWKVPIFTHVRSMGPDAMQEVIANAAATGVALHIVHVNSMSLGSLPFVLDLIESARRQGLDITTEAYPYTAASTFLESTMFDDGWQQRLGISYGELQWVKTGERLTQETFERYRQQGGAVIMHMMKNRVEGARLRFGVVLPHQPRDRNLLDVTGYPGYELVMRFPGGPVSFLPKAARRLNSETVGSKIGWNAEGPNHVSALQSKKEQHPDVEGTNATPRRHGRRGRLQ